MGTKNLYENGPNSFFYSGPKIGSESNLWQRFCFGMVPTTSLSLSMRGRYNNKKFRMKIATKFSTQKGRDMQEQTSWSSTVVLLHQQSADTNLC